MIQPREFAQQLIHLQKISFFSCYDAASKMQDQATSAVDTLLDQATWFPEEGRRVILSWAGLYQKECDRFRSYVEKSFTHFEKVFSEDAVVKPTRKKKPSTVKTKKTVSAKPKKTKAVETEKAAPAGSKKAGALEAEKAAPAVSKKAGALEAEKAAPAVSKKAGALEAEKAAPAVSKKAGALEAEKAAPAEAKSDRPTAVKPSGPMSNKGTSV